MAEISRRTVLRGGVVLAGLAAGAGMGLTKAVRHKVAVPPPPPPTALTDALARQQRLLADHDAVADGHYAGWPAVGSLRSDVVAHGDALHALLERYPGWRLAHPASSGSAGPVAPSGSAGPVASSRTTSAAATAPAMTIDQLAAASSTGARAFSQAAQAWPAAEQHAAEVVPVLASIAACLASHAQVLAQ